MALPANLPEAPADDSMLTRRLGKETVHYFAASPLNRYSFLRSDPLFLNAAAASPAARFLALNRLDPLLRDASSLALFRAADVRPLVGPDPFGDAYHVRAYDSSRPGAPLLVFLGIRPGDGGAEIPTEAHGVVQGQPFFAVDVTPRGGGEVAEAFLKAAGATTVSVNARNMALKPGDAAMYALARSVIDWHSRNAFCAGCGRPTVPSEAGFKRLCPATDAAAAASSLALPDCPTRHGTSNLAFPRTDPTMIAVVVSADGHRVLLGRQPHWPARRYSALAGFLEPGESVEDAVRREVWEESGVRVGRVAIHSSQPWPFPACLMIGAVAQALPHGEVIERNDGELEDARWFTMAQVSEALDQGGSALRNVDGGEPGFEGDLRLPPPQAIAHRMLRAVVEGYLTAAPRM